jgi:hypothetical protein
MRFRVPVHSGTGTLENPRIGEEDFQASLRP